MSGDGGLKNPQSRNSRGRGLSVHVLPQGADSQGTVLAAHPAREAGQELLRVQHQHGMYVSTLLGRSARCGTVVVHQEYTKTAVLCHSWGSSYFLSQGS